MNFTLKERINVRKINLKLEKKFEINKNNFF